jgi:hypothetical protein
MSTKIPILSVYDENGNEVDIPAIRGKSAYQYAKDGGYAGTETEFATLLGNIEVGGSINLDGYATEEWVNEKLSS